MALRPYSADLQQTFRSTLSTPGAPEVIDDEAPVQAVAIVAGNLNTVVTVNPTKYDAALITGTRAVTGSSGDVTLGTVPASRKWRIIAMNLACGMQGAAGNGTGQIRLNGVNALTLAANGAGEAATSLSFGFDACPTLTAGQLVVVRGELLATNAPTVSANVYYIEEIV